MLKKKMISCLAVIAAAAVLTACGAEGSAPAVSETAASQTAAAETTPEAETTAAETTAAGITTTEKAAESELTEAEKKEAGPSANGTASVKDIAGMWYEKDALDPRVLTINEDGTFVLEYKGGGSRVGTVTIDYETFGSGDKRAWYHLTENDDTVWLSFPEDLDGEQLIDIWGVTEEGEVSFIRDTALRDEGYPVDLAALKRGTDIRSLSNAEAHRFDGGEVSVDLDGDGSDDIIDFSHTKTVTVFDEEEITERSFCINGVEMEAVKKSTDDEWYSDDYKAVDSYSDYFYICDIDSSDGLKEIAFVPCAYTNEYETYFYRYENSTLYFIGSIVYDVPDSELEKCDAQLDGIYITDYNPMIIDGSGTITAAVRCNEPQVWFGYSRYVYDEAKGMIVSEENIEIYPYGYDLKDDYEKTFALLKDSYYSDGCSLLKEVEVYREHNEDSEHFTMQPQPACPTGVLYHWYDWESDDYDYWVYITAEDGTGGWIHYTEYPDYSDPLFSALTLYD